MRNPLASRIIAFAGKLDLGRKIEGIGPCSPASSAKSMHYYPTVWVDDQDAPVDLPPSGKAVVHYKVVSRTSRERDGKTKHDASIEIHSIEPMSKEETGKQKAGTAVPVKLQGLAPGMIQFSRQRDGDGQFVPETATGADPNVMAKAYGPAVLQKFPVRKAAAAAGILGGAGAAAVLGRRYLRAK